MRIVCPSRPFLGDSIIAVNNACLLAKQEDVLLVPRHKIVNSVIGKRSMECFEFALGLFDLGSLGYSMRTREADLLPKLPQSSYLDHAKRFIRGKPELVLLDLNPRFRPHSPDYKTLFDNSFTEDLKEKIWERAYELGTPVDLHTTALREGLQATLSMFLRAKCFIGADSGFAHVSHALDVPCFMFLNRGRLRRLKEWHEYNQYTLVNSPDEIILESTYQVGKITW